MKRLVIDRPKHSFSFNSIDISSIIFSLRSDKCFLKPYLILSRNVGNFVPKCPSGIPKEVCIVILPICIAVTPVGPINHTLGFHLHMIRSLSVTDIWFSWKRIYHIEQLQLKIYTQVLFFQKCAGFHPLFNPFQPKYGEYQTVDTASD